MITIVPLGSRVLVEHKPLPEITGSIIRVNRKEYAVSANVIAVGPEVRDVKVGDVVHVPVIAGQQIESYHLIQESAILAVLDAAS